MERSSRRMGILILAAVVAIEVLLAILWTQSPEDVRGLIVLAGGVFAVLTYLGLYVLQRRTHW